MATKQAAKTEPKVGTALDRMTMGELEELEEFIGRPIDTLDDPNASKVKATIGLAWLIRRREAPETTVDDIRALTSAEIAEVLDVDPTTSTNGASG